MQTSFVQARFDGENLVTNYLETEYARKGYVFCVIRRRVFHILLPMALADGTFFTNVIDEMTTGKKVVIETSAAGVNFMFDDGTETPYRLFLDKRQFSTLPSEGDSGRQDVTVLVYAPEQVPIVFSAEMA